VLSLGFFVYASPGRCPPTKRPSSEPSGTPSEVTALYKAKGQIHPLGSHSQSWAFSWPGACDLGPSPRAHSPQQRGKDKVWRARQGRSRTQLLRQPWEEPESHCPTLVPKKLSSSEAVFPVGLDAACSTQTVPPVTGATHTQVPATTQVATLTS
jgi:hypothetical protein